MSDHLTMLRAFGAFLDADRKIRMGLEKKDARGSGLSHAERKRKIAQLKAAMGEVSDRSMSSSSSSGGGFSGPSGSSNGRAGAASRKPSQGQAWKRIVAWCDRNGLSARALRQAQRVWR